MGINHCCPLHLQCCGWGGYEQRWNSSRPQECLATVLWLMSDFQILINQYPSIFILGSYLSKLIATVLIWTLYDNIISRPSPFLTCTIDTITQIGTLCQIVEGTRLAFELFSVPCAFGTVMTWGALVVGVVGRLLWAEITCKYTKDDEYDNWCICDTHNKTLWEMFIADIGLSGCP